MCTQQFTWSDHLPICRSSLLGFISITSKLKLVRRPFWSKEMYPAGVGNQHEYVGKQEFKVLIENGQRLSFHVVSLAIHLSSGTKHFFSLISIKGHGSELNFPRFLHKSRWPRSLTLHFEPFRFWLRIRGDILIRKRLLVSVSRVVDKIAWSIHFLNL